MFFIIHWIYELQTLAQKEEQGYYIRTMYIWRFDIIDCSPVNKHF